MLSFMTWLRGLLRNLAWLTRPRLPWPLARVVLARRTRRALTSEYERAVALEQMSHLLGDVRDRTGIEASVDAYIEFARYEAALRWHPKRSTNQRIEGIEHLLAAHAEGRGVILHFAHHGFFSGMFAAVSRASGLAIGAVARDKALGWDVGPNLRQHMLVARRGGELVYAGEGKEGIARRLAAGQVVAMAADAPGSSVVTFAGHEVTCSSGAVWAARDSGAPIVTVDTFRDEHGPVLRLATPLHPGDHPDPQALLQEIVARHEEAILAWPEATYAPTLAWPRADGRPSPAPLRPASVVVPKPFAKAVVQNASWLLHPRLPWPLAERRLAVRTERALASPAHRATAAEQMAHLLGSVATDDEVAGAAERYVRFTMRDAELRWHPRRAIDQRVEGLDHVRAAAAAGHGVVVSFVHHGHYAGIFGAIRRAGLDHVTVVRAGALGWHSGPGQRQTFMVFRRGGPLVDVREGVAGIVDRLRQGQVVMIATDVPGSSVVELAGRKVTCSSGAVWAAREAGAPIVCVDSWQDGDATVVRFGVPLAPADFADPHDLLQRIVSEHEAAILAWPEAALMPTHSWVAAAPDARLRIPAPRGPERLQQCAPWHRSSAGSRA